jgi:hypothetical protein
LHNCIKGNAVFREVQFLPCLNCFVGNRKIISGGHKMAKKNIISEIIKKEVKKDETVNVFDRHTLNWFLDSKTRELIIGKSLSDFLNKETENFIIKTVHSCDEKYWKLAETMDGKFVLLNRNKLLK